MSQVWSQSYTLFGRGLVVSSLIACIPIITLLFLLGVRRKPAWFAALWALLGAVLVALFAYKLPPVLTASAAAY
ncbi:MAG TPA: L-lactate permease, partial [Acidobacteriaceae bacterium]|nr:L-lactate permease [Acidobacteriaceae bacterium]